MKTTRKKFFKGLIDTNQQILWLAEYNIEMARDTIKESYKRVPYVEREIERWEKRKEKIESSDIRKGLAKDHYKKLQNAKQFIKDLHKEIEGEIENRKEARNMIKAHKNKLIGAQMKIAEETKHLNKKKFNLEEEIDKESKDDKSESK